MSLPIEVVVPFYESAQSLASGRQAAETAARSWLKASGFPIDNRQSKIDNHSYRSATMGSTFAARRAGI